MPPSAGNQLSKLKENLKGFAKSLIPATVTDIERSFSILEHAFGDSMKVVNHRIDNLMKVGPWPAAYMTTDHPPAGRSCAVRP